MARRQLRGWMVLAGVAAGPGIASVSADGGDDHGSDDGDGHGNGGTGHDDRDGDRRHDSSGLGGIEVRLAEETCAAILPLHSHRCPLINPPV